MIEINLIPPQLRKKEGRGVGILSLIALPKQTLLGVGGLFVALLILIHALSAGMWVIKAVRHVVYKGVWQKMSPDKTTVDSINQEVKDLKSKMSTITDIASKKAFLWSRKLNILSDAMPKGIWIRRISWNNTVLTIEGSAVSRLHDEISLAGDFVANLKKQEAFAKDFSVVELGSITRGKKGVTELVDFTITAKTK